MIKGGGESLVPDLAREEKRRQLTILALGIGLFVSTIPVNNQRALFSPLGDIPILGNLTPTAYAVTFGGVPGIGRPGYVVPPAAYAARVPSLPSDGAPRGGQPFTGTPFSGPPVESSSSTPPTSSVGNGSPGFIDNFGPGVPADNSGSGLGNGAGGGTSPSAPGGTGSGDGGGGGLPPPSAVGAVPEPATWLTMIIGFGVIGGVMRRVRRRDLARGRRVIDSRSRLNEG